MQKKFLVAQLLDEDRFIEIDKSHIYDDYDNAWGKLAQIVEANTGLPPARHRLNDPVSVELPGLIVQLWIVSMPDNPEK